MIVPLLAQGWLGTFQYRIPLILQADVPATDVEILLTIATDTLIASGRLQPTCADLRFTLSDGVTQIPYYVESGCNTAQTRVWIRVPALTGNFQADTFYMYVGDTTVNSFSDPAQVFHFWEGFDSSALDPDRWVAIEPAQIQISGGWVNMIANTGYPWEKFRSRYRVARPGYIVEFLGVPDANGGNLYHWLYVGTYPYTFTNDGTLCDGGICAGDNLNWGTGCGWGDFQLYAGSSGARVCNGNPMQEDTPFVLSMWLYPGDSVRALFQRPNTYTVLSQVTMTGYAHPDSAYVIPLCEYGGTCRTDWIRIRKIPPASLSVVFGSMEPACVFAPSLDTGVVLLDSHRLMVQDTTVSQVFWFDCSTGAWIDTGRILVAPYSGTFFAVLYPAEPAFTHCPDTTACVQICIDTLDTRVMVVGDSMLFALESRGHYQWYQCASDTGGVLSFLSGDTLHWLLPDTPGFYAVVLQYRTCTDTSECVWVGFQPISAVSDPAGAHSERECPTLLLSLQNEQIYIRMSGPSSEVWSLEVYSAEGRRILSAVQAGGSVISRHVMPLPSFLLIRAIHLRNGTICSYRTLIR